jgi:hypothetical protein
MLVTRKDLLAYQCVVVLLIAIISSLTAAVIFQAQNKECYNESIIESEIGILREQLSDLWYLNGLDSVDIEKD